MSFPLALKFHIAQARKYIMILPIRPLTLSPMGSPVRRVYRSCPPILILAKVQVQLRVLSEVCHNRAMYLVCGFEVGPNIEFDLSHDHCHGFGLQ